MNRFPTSERFSSHLVHAQGSLQPCWKRQNTASLANVNKESSQADFDLSKVDVNEQRRLLREVSAVGAMVGTQKDDAKLAQEGEGKRELKKVSLARALVKGWT